MMMIPVVFSHDSTECLKRANHYESVGREAADLSPYRNKVEGCEVLLLLQYAQQERYF